MTVGGRAKFVGYEELDATARATAKSGSADE
ncbi:hypothetical protein JJ691_59210 [Kutzneria sp. CA-103260]|nr:hypothetical protein JJ691_59210 [Kutzneria sp. CA-103260]